MTVNVGSQHVTYDGKWNGLGKWKQLVCCGVGGGGALLGQGVIDYVRRILCSTFATL